MPLESITRDHLIANWPYRNRSRPREAADEYGSFFWFEDGGINTTSGFRPKRKSGGSSDIEASAFVVLSTSGGEPEWPDSIDHAVGMFTYFGDNRRAETPLLETPLGGNRLLKRIFQLTEDGRRADVQPLLGFRQARLGGEAYMQFIGLLCPAVERRRPLLDLVTHTMASGTCENYKARFVIMREPVVSRAWLLDLVAGISPVESLHCPESWRKWVRTGEAEPLLRA